MEKRKPHCPLPRVKAMIEVGAVRTTQTAREGANNLGIDEVGMLRIVAALDIADFHKSMTAYHDHRIWHDVYRPTTQAGELYIKLIVMDDVLIVSFKELGS